MAFFDELSKKLSGVSRVAVRKAKEVTDIGSLKLQIADENRKLSKIYENLGREYYDRFQNEAAEELSGLVKQIKDSTDKVAALQDEISRVEEERVRREAEAQARRESVAEAEMREVDEYEDEEYEDDEEAAKKNGEMTGYEEETTGEEAAEDTDETEDEVDTAYAEETEEAAEEETVAEEGEADETAELASEEEPGDAETEEPEQNSEWL